MERLAAQWSGMADLIERAYLPATSKEQANNLASSLRLIASTIAEQPDQNTVQIEKTLFLTLFSNFNVFTKVLDHYRENQEREKPAHEGKVAYIIPRDQRVRTFFNEARKQQDPDNKNNAAFDKVSIAGQFAATVLMYFSEHMELAADAQRMKEELKKPPAPQNIPDLDLV